MTSLAVKILRDEDGNEFVPYTSTDALYDPDGETIADKIAEKLETSSLIAGTGITLIPDTTNHTVEIDCSLPGATLINNLTTSTSGQGALDAYQGYILKNSIPTKLNQLNDRTTDLLSEPRFRGSTTVTTRPLFMMTRGNRLTLLPPNQVIIEKSTDAGVTWESWGATDDQKRNLFNGRNTGSIQIPLKNGVKSTDCMVRITFTGMRYTIPDGTTETNKYNYWNSSSVASCERYCQLHTLYFWVTAVNDKIWIQVERSTGGNSNTWSKIFDTSTNADRVGLSGWSGMDFVTFTPSTFGGGTSQTGNYWNYRITFRTCSKTTTSDATLFDDANLDTTWATNAQAIYGINGYGDTMWTVPNNMAYIDHAYTWDNSLNVTFPAKITTTNTITGASLISKSIELSGATPYIDFHYNNSSADYTSRIIETGSGTLSVEANLIVNGQIKSVLSSSRGEGWVGAADSIGPIYLYANGSSHGIWDTGFGRNIITVTSSASTFNGTASWADGATYANYLYGFSGYDTSQGWGSQTGTFISGMHDSTGGSIAFRRDNPTAGQMSVIIDGRFYQREGNQVVLDASNFSFSNGTLYITTT